MVLTEAELIEVRGGAVKYGLWAALGGIITLIVGIIDGYLRPLACNK